MHGAIPPPVGPIADPMVNAVSCEIPVALNADGIIEDMVVDEITTGHARAGPEAATARLI